MGNHVRARAFCGGRSRKENAMTARQAIKRRRQHVASMGDLTKRSTARKHGALWHGARLSRNVSWRLLGALVALRPA
jgi:hypothetical protein